MTLHGYLPCSNGYNEKKCETFQVQENAESKKVDAPLGEQQDQITFQKSVAFSVQTKQKIEPRSITSQQVVFVVRTLQLKLHSKQDVFTRMARSDWNRTRMLQLESGHGEKSFFVNSQSEVSWERNHECAIQQQGISASCSLGRSSQLTFFRTTSAIFWFLITIVVRGYLFTLLFLSLSLPLFLGSTV